jgi:hypothetical protein
MQRLGLEKLLGERVDLGGVSGRANVGLKGIALIAALLAGAKWINDMAVLRAGETAKALGQWVAAPSTMGTFLRAFTWGHVRQLDAVSGELLARAWQAGAGPGATSLTIDVTPLSVRRMGCRSRADRSSPIPTCAGITRS